MMSQVMYTTAFPSTLSHIMFRDSKLLEFSLWKIKCLYRKSLVMWVLRLKSNTREKHDVLNSQGFLNFQQEFFKN